MLDCYHNSLGVRLRRSRPSLAGNAGQTNHRGTVAQPLFSLSVMGSAGTKKPQPRTVAAWAGYPKLSNLGGVELQPVIEVVQVDGILGVTVR
jgi:hypothetical protein